MNSRVLKREPQGAQSIEVGFTLLNHLARATKPVMADDIAGAAGLAPARVRRFMSSFEQSGFVVGYLDGTYSLGPAAVLIGLAAQHRIDEFRLVDEALMQLQQRTGATASAVVWGNHGPTIIRRVEPARAVTVTTRVGSVIPVTRSSSGLVFAAFLPLGLVDSKVANELDDGGRDVRKTQLRQRFEKRVRETRKQGVATIKGDFVEGVDAIAAPVYGPAGEVWVSLAVIGLHGSFDVNTDGVPQTILLEVTRALSIRVGAQLSFHEKCLTLSNDPTVYV